MPYALVILLLTAALGEGGYAPWATFVLELGAAGLWLWVVLEVLWGTRPEEQARFLERKRTWRRLPFLARHPGAGRILYGLSLGRLGRRDTVLEVEILPPGTTEAGGGPSHPLSEYWILHGYAFARAPLSGPLFFLTLWIVLSLVPWSSDVLQTLSPMASDLWGEAQSLLPENQGPSSFLPWSLTPFLTLRSLCLWLAYLALFYASFHLSRTPERVDVLARLLVLLGVGLGTYGVLQWLLGVQQLLENANHTLPPLARATFDNRNHYAAFMAMELLCALGWLGSRWVATASRDSPHRRGNRLEPIRRRGSPAMGDGATSHEPLELKAQEARARLAIAGLGIVLLSLGLVFSLSRSGISFALAGCAAFALMTGRSTRASARVPGVVELERERSPRPSRRSRWGANAQSAERERSARHIYVVVSLVVLGAVVWMGIEPVVRRFEMLPEDWNAETGRWQVWVDSLGAIRDFWPTGTGLSSFRYVFPMYRSFGGRISYSWAHNDYLQLLVELGIPGLLLLVWIMTSVWRAARRARSSVDAHPSLGLLHSGYCAAAIAIGLHSFTDFSLHMPANAALLAVIAGVVTGMRGGAGRQPRSA